MGATSQAIEPEKEKITGGEKDNIELAKEATEDMVTDDTQTV